MEFRRSERMKEGVREEREIKEDRKKRNNGRMYGLEGGGV